MEKYKCNAHGCWCGNIEFKVANIINQEIDNLLLETSDGGIYMDNGGSCEHWANKADFCQEYPDAEI